MRRRIPKSFKEWQRGARVDYYPGDFTVRLHTLTAVPFNFCGVWMAHIDGVTGRVPLAKLKLKRGPKPKKVLRMPRRAGVA